MFPRKLLLMQKRSQPAYNKPMFPRKPNPTAQKQPLARKSFLKAPPKKKHVVRKPASQPYKQMFDGNMSEAEHLEYHSGFNTAGEQEQTWLGLKCAEHPGWTWKG